MQRNQTRHSGLVLLLPVVLAAIAICAGSYASHADASLPAPKYVTVPVYYLTDRNLSGDKFGNQRRYQTDCQHHMYYGTTFVTVENHSHESAGKATDSLNWKFADERPKDKDCNDLISLPDPLEAKTAFFVRLKNALDQTGGEQLCVYVHGAAEGFADAAADAGELAYALHRPLVLYSWPSEPKLLDYVVDNGNSEWSQGHFNVFLRDLQAFKDQHPLHLILLAHSMGNRFLFRSMRFLYRHELVNDCEFVSPDMDIDTCRHYLLGLHPLKYDAQMRLYVSNRDKMLKLSQKLFGGYERLGEDVRAHLIPERYVERLTVLKEPENGKGRSESAAANNTGDKPIHTSPGSALQPAQTVSADSSAKESAPKSEDHSSNPLLERIDFTAIDKGLTGHSIPFQLISDLLDGRKSSSGIEVVEDNSDPAAAKCKIARPASP